MSKNTTRKNFTYIEATEAIKEYPTKNETFAKQADELNEGQQDYLQAGVTPTSWAFSANIVAGTGELGSTAEVAESIAWLPDPVKSAEGALMRSKTAKASIAKKVLTTGSLPAEGKFSCVAFELTPTSWNKEATVTTKAGTEQATAAAAEENPPATSSGKLQIRQVIVKRAAGPTYTIEAQKDVRPWAGTAMQIGPSSAYTASAGITPTVEQIPSATRPTFVIVQGQGLAVKIGAIGMNVPVAEKEVSFSFICPAGVGFKATGAGLKVQYLTL